MLLFIYIYAISFKANRVKNMFGNIENQLGPLKLLVRKKQFSVVSHAAASMLGELIHLGIVHVNIAR
jgi:hypothetical protein